MYDDTDIDAYPPLTVASTVRCATGAGGLLVAVPFGERWLDIDHDLITVTGDFDAMQTAM